MSISEGAHLDCQLDHVCNELKPKCLAIPVRAFGMGRATLSLAIPGGDGLYYRKDTHSLFAGLLSLSLTSLSFAGVSAFFGRIPDCT